MEPVAEAVISEDLSSPEVTEAPQSVQAEELVESELLVEEVSIDGMCGVY